ncbi:hypothetical protein YM304_02610 [Ilumatobacter coccineus YM16-304]|uniref:PA14 domain-containing protein n=2 Tax=Ilumatobacter coccineus TaxID=467094 RepID=A0A6C7E5S3_ILUCY|nr:hypothetical protein YM304_02610 [Ilumatobacter coccineus YM16-304]
MTLSTRQLRHMNKPNRPMGSDMRNNSTATKQEADRDRGAVLAFVLIFFVFAGLTVVATLTFAQTLMQNRPPINERNARVEAVRSAMRMAIQFQRDHGVGDCFQNSQTFTFNAGTPEEVDAQVDCTIGPVEDLDNNYFREGGDAFALITTLSDGSFAPVTGSALGIASPNKLISGNAFYAGGDVTPPLLSTRSGIDVLVGDQTGGTPSQILTTRLDGARYGGLLTDVTCDDPVVSLYFPSSGTAPDGSNQSNTFQCTDLEWTDRAGTRVAPATTWSYPNLPGIPVNSRPAFLPRSFGFDEDNGTPGARPECRVIFPGRYDDPLVFDGSLHPNGVTYYLPSGVYYLTEPMTVINGARVVAGQGRSAGCEVDSTVLLDSRTVDLEATSITGRGATFILDDDARITVEEGQLMINRRISTPSTRGSEGIAVRTVQTSEIDEPNLSVPEDDVVTGVDSNGDRILAPANSYSIGDPLTAATLTYSGIDVDPDGDDAIVSADFRDGGSNGAANGTNALIIDGSVFTPQGKFVVRANNSDYRMKIDGGVVATRAELDVTTMPSNPSNWYLGVDASPLLRRVQLEATAVIGGRTARSVAIFQVNSVGNYAINSWIVDPNGSTGGWGGGSSTGGTTDGGTTDGGTTDGGTTDGGTTDGGTTDGGTTDGGTTDGGTTDGGTTDGGTTDGGTTDGGTTDGGTTDGGTTDGGTTDGGTTDGGTTDGGTTDGGTTDGGTTDGGTTDGGTTDGGTTDAPPCTDPTKWAVSFFDNTTLSGKVEAAKCEDNVSEPWAAGSPAPGIDDDYFSARYTKTVDFPDAGVHTFTIGADDGVRMYIDGSLVYNRWVDKSFSTETVDVNLTAGSHDIRIEYYEQTGYAQLEMSWEFTGPPPCPADDPSWYAEYYNGTSLKNNKFEFATYETEGPNWNWYTGEPYPTYSHNLGNDTFSVRWTRLYNFPEAGTYRFTVGSDDGIRLYVNGTREINNWNVQSYNGSLRTADVVIEDRCQVLIEVRYYEKNGGAQVSYEWERIGDV